MRTKVRGLEAFLLAMALVTPAWAQTPQGTSFTYQGRLTEAGALPSGPYDFQFVLYDASVGGTQVGPTVALDDVTVSAGLFTVNLDFGIVFGGEKRWLELGVRLGADTGPYTPILPRQELTPGPSAIFSTAAGDSLELGGLPASQYVQTDDARLSDARDPLPGSPDYVQNGSAPQAGVSFNVGGTGTASILDAATQFNLGGNRILSNPGTNNLFAGANSGASNTTGVANAFFGAEAGFANTTGGSNSFFGFNAGRNTTTSGGNSFFGDAAGFNNTTGGGSFFGFLAGFNNTTGNLNAFFGRFAGSDNTTGTANALFGDSAGRSNSTGNFNNFFGQFAGADNTTGSANEFFGTGAGQANTTGSSNIFVGFGTGTANTTGNSNTLLGNLANVGAPSLSFATAVGAGAVVAASNTIVLGRAADAVLVPGPETVAGTLNVNGAVTMNGALTVAGTLGAGVVNAQTQYNISGSRVLSSAGIDNLSVGVGAGSVNSGFSNAFFGTNAGQANTTGGVNAFFGAGAGQVNTIGSSNSFFGQSAGRFNTTGSSNSFFGNNAGNSNTTAVANSFFGKSAGVFNTTGDANSFFGQSAGTNNTTGTQNVIFGSSAGNSSNGSFNVFVGTVAGNHGTTGSNNTFLGWSAGGQNTTGNDNTFVGTLADWNSVGAGNANTLVGANTQVIGPVSNATAIGNRALAIQSNSVVVGGISGVNGGIDTQVAIGTNTPSARLHIRDNGGNILFGGSAGCPNLAGIVFSTSISATCQNYSMLGGDGSTYINRPGGGTIFFRENNVTEVSIKPGGIVGIQALAGGGTATLCRNPQNEVAFCSSSLRYKTDVQPFAGGLDLVDRLQPISFTWKANGKRDIGLGAEDVAQVAPLLVFRNGDGEIEGVNYTQLNVVLVNAVKQQQTQLRRQQQEIDALKALVCQASPQAGVCLEAATPD